MRHVLRWKLYPTSQVFGYRLATVKADADVCKGSGTFDRNFLVEIFATRYDMTEASRRHGRDEGR